MQVDKLTTVKDVKELGQLLSDLPFLRKQAEARAAEIQRERRAAAVRLVAARGRRDGPAGERLAKQLTAARVARETAEATAREMLATAADRLRDAAAAQFEFQAGVDREIRALEDELRTTADPRIGEFIESLFAEHAATSSKAGRVDGMRSTRDPITDQVVHFNQHAVASGEIHARLAAILAAVTAAESLRFDPGADVEAELARIKATIPHVSL